MDKEYRIEFIYTADTPADTANNADLLQVRPATMGEAAGYCRMLGMRASLCDATGAPVYHIAADGKWVAA